MVTYDRNLLLYRALLTF